MRVKAGPDAARARRHVSTCRPDISGTFPCDLSLLRHRVCRREQHDGTDCKNNLLHRLVLPDVLTCCVQSPRADVQSLAHSCRSEPGDLVSQTRCHRWLRAAHGASPIMLIARSELPPLPVAIPVIGLLVSAIAVVRLIRVPTVALVRSIPIAIWIVVCAGPVVPVPIRAPMRPAIDARNASWSEGTTNHR